MNDPRVIIQGDVKHRDAKKVKIQLWFLMNQIKFCNKFDFIICFK